MPRIVCVAFALVFASTSTLAKQSDAANASTERQPNVLILLIDDMTNVELGSVNPAVLTPNIDKLASEGVQFTRYAVNHPQCSPSRATLLTGLYATVHGTWINNLQLNSPHTNYLAEVFERAGYETGYVGKWHLDGGPYLQFRLRSESYVPRDRRRGFDDWLGYECCTDHNAPFFWDDSIEPPVFTSMPEFGWEPRWQRAALRDFVERQKAAGKPWMYEVAIGPPHSPEEAPREFVDLYPLSSIPLPDWLPQDLTPEQQLVARRILRIVYAMVTFVDAEVGNMMADLEELGEDQNTIVILAGDNGDLLGSHWDEFRRKPYFFRGKDRPYQNSFRVPLIMRWPGHIPANQRLDTLISGIDMAPTILSMAGLPIPWRMQGDDMSDWAFGSEGPTHPAVWLHLKKFRAPTFTAVWNGDYILSASGIRALYDLRNDPYERNNLFNDPEFSDVKRELASLLVSMVAEANHPPTLPNLCADRETIEQQLQAAVGQNDPRVDGMTLRAHLELLLAVGCGQGDISALQDALLGAYGRNLDHFDRADFLAARPYRELVALGTAGGATLTKAVRSLFKQQHGITLAGAYEYATCNESGECFPADAYFDSTNNDAGPLESLAGSGDIDGDGVSNAAEYRNARGAGTGIAGFVRAATDPALNGSESDAGDGGGGGACFIATAAYGSPLAAELDRFRSLRDRGLLVSATGSAFTDAYYRLSPRAAAWLAAEPHVKPLVRAALAAILILIAHPAALALAFVACAGLTRRLTRLPRG